MPRLTRVLALCLLLTPSFLSLALGQGVEKGVPADKSQVITATTTLDHVRVAAPSAVVQLRLEVYDEAGQKLFDTEQRGGNVLDWHLQSSNGERIADGSYLCVVTVKNLSGRFSQKLGLLAVNAQSTTLHSATVPELNLRQAQAVGPVESGHEGLVVKPVEDPLPVAVLSHTGEEAQLTRTRGPLSFRLGDFFSGSDKEQMRLTEEGNLGIGTTKPKTRLDVAGTIRAREGFMFSDGSTLKVNDKGVLTRTSADGAAPAAVTSTQNRIAKFTDNAGTVGDSVAIDTGTGLQLTAPPNPSVDTNLLYLNSTNGTTGVLAGNTPSYGAANGPFFAMRANNYTTIANQRGLFTIAAGNVSSPIGDDGSVKFNTGNDLLRMVIRPNGRVGIGVDIPAKKLDVGGDINISGDYNIGGDRVLSILGTGNVFLGVNAGQVNTGFQNSFFGSQAGNHITGGADNSFFGWSAGFSNTNGTDNSFFGESAGFTNDVGIGNSFFGRLAGNSNTVGHQNTFVGKSAGFSNSNGDNNSFFGTGAGNGNTTGDHNTAIGFSADVGSDNLDHATAIGADAEVSASNTIALGRSDGSDTVDVPGKLQIDTMATSGGSPLCLNGSNRVALCGASSLRYKTEVHSFFGGLNIVQRLRPISFSWKEDGARDVGLGAEEVARVEPLLAFRNKKGEIEGVKYNQLSAVFINAFKEQQREIQELQKQIRNLKSRISKHHRQPVAPR